MAKRVSVDGWMFTVTLLLVFVGLVMVFSASAVMAKDRYGSGYYFLLRQMVLALAGIIAMVVAMKVDYHRYKHPAVVFSALGLTTFLLISVFFLDRSHNTHRWIHWAGLSFQPSELAKPALILFLAYFLESRTKSMDDWRNTLLPAIIPTLVFLGLIVAQPDLGTAIACAAITVCILFVGGIDLRYLAYGFAASLLPLYLSDFPRRLSSRPHSGLSPSLFRSAERRLPHHSVADRGQHRRHYRRGLMEGKQKLFYLPEPHTDFIFSVIWEELGLVGAVIVVALFAIFLWRGVRTGLANPGYVRTISGGRHYQHDCGAGVHQHQRGAGPDADQGHPAALYLLRRVVAVHYSGLRGCAAERQQAGGMISPVFSVVRKS